MIIFTLADQILTFHIWNRGFVYLFFVMEKEAVRTQMLILICMDETEGRF